MPDILTTAMTGLVAFQRALATTGHNISNANTEGYSRQRVDLASRIPQPSGGGFIGSGTQVRTVERIYNALVSGELMAANSAQNRLEAFYTLASRMDEMLADPQAGLSPSLQAFFNAVQDVADDPASIPARQALLSEAEALADRFQSLGRGFADLSEQVNARVKASVDNINSLAESIAKLNDEIVRLSGSVGQPPNDLLDQRDLLLRQLSEEIDVSTLVQDDGAINVFIGNGQTLVIGNQANPLKATGNVFNPTTMDVVFPGPAGNTLITSQLKGGALGGALDFRREILDPARNALGRVALAVAETVNAQHREGMDLNGQLGLDFFAVAGPQVLPESGNTGTGSVTATVSDVSALTTGDYILSYDGVNYSLARAETGIAVPMTGSGSPADPFVAEGLNIVVGAGAAAGDRFSIEPTRTAASSFRNLISDPARVAAAAPVRTLAAGGNVGDAVISAGEVIDSTDPNLLSPVLIQFTSPTTYSINGAGSFPYTPQADIDVNGVRVQIDGTPATGDSFTIEANAGGVGDNRNALLMGTLPTTDILDGGTASFQDGYGRLVSQVGSATRQADVNLQAQSIVQSNAQLALESTSGVNLDEEAANLIRFQQSYQAAAQLIGVVDTLFQTLMSTVRR